MADQPLYFVHISDTHIGPTKDFSRWGRYSLPNAERVVGVINNLPTLPDFVIHTGDLADDPHPEAYLLAKEAFSQLKSPIYFATGNHDTARDIAANMQMGDYEKLDDDPDRLFFRFMAKGVECLVLDGRGADEIDPHGLLPANQLAYIKKTAHQPGPPLLIFCHFPAAPMDSPWFDAEMLLLNGDEVHQALIDSSRLRGYFHGHIHQNMQTMKDGVFYCSVGSTFVQFGGWPHEDHVLFDTEHPPAYSFVHMLPEQIIVHQHTFPPAPLCTK